MAIGEKIEWIEVEHLCLDPKNPRLGRHFTAKSPTQTEILEVMREWALEELAVSFLESGFWTQEALVVVEEKLEGQKRLIVVEGNRRLAAIKLLLAAASGDPVPPSWKRLAADADKERLHALKRVPCVHADTRQEVQAYLGFRHVSGIKEWDPAEKAEFIAHLIEDQKLTYEQVMRRIGSKTPAVRQNYITYRLLRQMEEQSEEISIEHVEKRFSVLYLSLRTAGVREYLKIDIDADPKSARFPVPKSRIGQLEKFAKWLFGSAKEPPIVQDSRDIDAFGKNTCEQESG